MAVSRSACATSKVDRRHHRSVSRARARDPPRHGERHVAGIRTATAPGSGAWSGGTRGRPGPGPSIPRTTSCPEVPGIRSPRVARNSTCIATRPKKIRRMRWLGSCGAGAAHRRRSRPTVKGLSGRPVPRPARHTDQDSGVSTPGIASPRLSSTSAGPVRSVGRGRPCVGGIDHRRGARPGHAVPTARPGVNEHGQRGHPVEAVVRAPSRRARRARGRAAAAASPRRQIRSSSRASWLPRQKCRPAAERHVLARRRGVTSKRSGSGTAPGRGWPTTYHSADLVVLRDRRPRAISVSRVAVRAVVHDRRVPAEDLLDRARDQRRSRRAAPGAGRGARSARAPRRRTRCGSSRCRRP